MLKRSLESHDHSARAVPFAQIRQCLCWLFLAVLPIAATVAEDDDARFVEGLRQRQLYALAEDFCQERLADDRLPEAERIAMAIELIRSFAVHAANSPPDRRPPLWERARQTAADFRRDHPQTPQIVLLDVQDALTLLARGELLRQESEVIPDSDQIAEAARDVLREASRTLGAVADDLSKEIPLRHRRADQPGELSAQELISLQHHVRFHQARAFRNRALCYAADSDDRIAMLTQAVDVLKQALTQIDAGQSLANQMQIDLAACYRWLADFAAAQQALSVVLENAPTVQDQLEALAELARLELARRRPDLALVQIDRGRKLASSHSPRFDFACLETCIAMWRKARADDDPTQADTWRKQSVSMVKRIEQLHGPYWGRRADLLLVQAMGGASGAADVEVLVRMADNLYRTGQADEAISAYEQAAVVARNGGDVQEAFSLRYKAALVEHGRKFHQAAVEKLRALGLAMPTHAKAADVHLLAAWNMAQVSRDQPTALAAYEQILTEHLTTWPVGTTSDTVRLWLGRLRESQSSFEAAADAYRGIPREAPQYGEAVQAAARCWRRQIDRLREIGQPHGDLAETAATFFEQQVRGPLDDASTAWTPRDRFCAEQAARFWLETTPPESARAESVLAAALAASPDPEANWTNTAKSLLVVALAGQPNKRGKAEAVLSGLASNSPTPLSPTPLLDVVSAIAELSKSASEASRRELAGLQLAAIDKLEGQSSQCDASTRRLLAQVRAQSLALAGRGAEAVAAYEQLAEENPDDGAIQEAFAEQLLAAEDEASLRRALDQWRRVASRSEPHGQRWYRAKYAVASALHRLGDHQQAANRIRYHLTIPPGVKDAAWKAKFENLLQQCEDNIPSR